MRLKDTMVDIILCILEILAIVFLPYIIGMGIGQPHPVLAWVLGILVIIMSGIILLLVFLLFKYVLIPLNSKIKRLL